MTIETEFRELREERLRVSDRPIPDQYQDISKSRIREVLRLLDQEHQDTVDVVFALLDNETPNMFSTSPYGSKFCDGATVAHIGAHVGILQRGAGTKLDREGRDYWIKPLRELGAIEPIYLNPQTNSFIPGHPKPKSPNSAYRLADDFVGILQFPAGKWQQELTVWSTEERIRERARLQARAQEVSEQVVVGDHKNLIMACKELYVPEFLPDYKILFADFEDGQRITDAEHEMLNAAGVSIKLGDAMPDLLLWNPDINALWVIEAVTSDGEVDQHKVDRVLSIAKRSAKCGVGFTTAYPSWRIAAQRQGRVKNIAASTYIWIKEDPSKHFLASDMMDELRLRQLN